MALNDTRVAFRAFLRNPGFTSTAILALALGIGANTAIFSLIDGVLLRPLPFTQPDRLVNVWETNMKRNFPRFPVAPATYTDWRNQNAVFSALGAYQPSMFNLAATGNEPERFAGAVCDAGFFGVLAISPVLGRLFTEEEDQPGKDDVVLLGYELWQQRFGADRGIIGRAQHLDGRLRTVIGVMPQGFQYPPQAVMWAPLGMTSQARARRDLHQFRVMARLKDGITLDRARSDLSAIAVRLEHDYPALAKDEGATANLMLDDIVGDVRPALLVLIGAVAFLLLIACANVANLLLARAAARQREIAVRASLGASRSRIVRQMLTESVLLSSLGGVTGLLFAYSALHALVALAPANVPRLAEATLDWRALAFTLAISLGTGIVFGLAPAWKASRFDVNSSLKEGSRGSTAHGHLRGALVVAQVAAALILLAGAGLLVRSFQEILRVNAGFDPEHLMTMRLLPAQFKYQGHPEQQFELARGILRKVAALPGVRSAGIGTDIPLLGNPLFIMRFEGRPPVDPSEAPVANFFSVSPGFFDAMGMRIVRGRALNERDAGNSPLVVVVNQTLADRYFPNQNPIGKRLEIAFSTPPRWRAIVGVVADVHSEGLDQASPVQVYTAYLQLPGLSPAQVPPVTVLARTTGDPGAIGNAMKAAILSVDKSQPVFAVQPMSAIVANSIAQRRLALVLLAFFAASALFLGALGLYGVMSYTVTQRTSEIGIRLALGAQPAEVLFMVGRQGMALVLAGLAIGIAGALALTRLMASLLFHVKANDPLTFIAVAALLVCVSIAACCLPAMRASRVHPIVALRYE